MQRIIPLLLASAALTACSGTPPPERAAGASFYDRKEIPIEAVPAINVRGAFKVSVFGTADKAKVTLLGPPEMIADTRVTIEGETLSIAFAQGAEWNWNTGAGMHAFVQLPALNSVSLEGSGSIKVSGVKTDSFSAGTGGSGSISITELQANEVQLGIGGAGSISAQGTATNAMYGVGGAGSIDAKRLRVANAQIGIGGAGSVYADISEQADIGIGGAGRVDVVGGAECMFEPSQARQIECR